MIENLLIAVVNVQRPTPTKGTAGGEVDAYAPVYVGLACNIQPVTAAWQVLYGQRKIDVTHTVFFGSNPTIRPGDRLAFGGRTFLVQGVRDLITMSRVLAVDCLELT